MIRLLTIFTLAFCTFLLRGQDTISVEASRDTNGTITGGFIRGGLYTWKEKNDRSLTFPTIFSDFALKLKTTKGYHFIAYADVRFRYGSEFMEPVNKLDIREAWIGYSENNITFSAGQKIIRYGRCDFTNPTSRLSPTNMISRTPDREDMDMGNLLFSAKYYFSPSAEIEAVFVPCYRPSVLVVEAIDLPTFVTIHRLPPIVNEKGSESYAFKADFHFRMFDWSLSFFNGFDPIPGIDLTDFNLDLSNQIPEFSTDLSFTPYRTSVFGFDFETTAGTTGIRGESAFSLPGLSYNEYDYIPMPEIKWALGFDRSLGSCNLTAEYNGKFITDFKRTLVEPLIGNNLDLSQLAELLAIPGFDPEYYVRQQVIAFNRLYNNQLKKVYHSAAIKFEADLGYGKYYPSVMALYNFTSHDLLLIPELRLKPRDGITIVFGAEIYSGRKGSLFDLIDDFMNGAYLSLRADF